MVDTIATIDIGTNSVLLTIAAQQDNGELRPIFEDARITRIGEGLGQHQMFQAPAMQRTATVLRDYAQRCQQMQVNHIVAVGTAAFRHAQNAADFVAHVRDHCGFTIQVIPGKREAELSYRAAVQDFGHDILVLDIGGGSTEFIWPSVEGVQAHSLPVGSVSMEEAHVNSDPINEDDADTLRQACVDAATAMQAPIGRELPSRLVALAGTATTLGAMHLQLKEYVHAEVHGIELHITEVQSLLERLIALPLAERKKLRGLEPQRADVIVSGTMLLLETMRMYGYDRVTISDRGVRWGLLYEHFYDTDHA